MGTFELDVESGEVCWSLGSHRIFGIADEQIPPGLDALVGLAAVAHARRVRRAFAEAMHAGTAFDITWTAVRSDGSCVHVNTRAQAVCSDDGSVAEIVGTHVDVTERTEAVRQLRERERELEAAHKREALGQLAGGVAHDFNNLLTAILGFTQCAADELEPGHTAREDLEEVLRAGKRAQELTNQLLLLGQQQYAKPERVDLHGILRGMFPLLSRTLGDHIEIDCDYQPYSGSVRGDAGSIEQILLNFAVNARDAMPHGGKLTFHLEKKARAAFPDLPVRVKGDEIVALTVRDSGFGIDSATLERIFERFYSTKARDEGSGLGLSIVSGIVSRLGGHIEVESTVGQGTLFRVLLPYVDKPPGESRSGKMIAIAGGGTERILVVEDDDVVRRFASRSLRAIGYDVVEARNGAEALDIARAPTQHEFDLMVTDVVMPGMSGAELARLVLRDKPDLPVLYATGFTREHETVRGVWDAGARVLLKPFSRDQLAQHVRDALAEASGDIMVG